MFLLLDPQILIAGDVSLLHSESDYWRLISDWAADSRVRIGQQSQAAVVDSFGRYGYPDQALDVAPRALRSAYNRSLSSLLTKALASKREMPDSEIPDLVPEYAGDAALRNALVTDVVSAAEFQVVGVAAATDSWDSSVLQVNVYPPPPASFDICHSPGEVLGGEIEEQLAEYFSAVRLHIVGGRPDSRILEVLEQGRFRLAGRVTWIPSEKNKPPRNLDRTWGSLQPEVDITVCITGRIGHAASGKASRIAQVRQVPHLLVSSANEIEQSLIDHYLSRRDT